MRLTKGFNFSWQAIATHTEEPDDSVLSESINAYVDREWVDSSFYKDYTATYDGETFWGHGLFACLEYNSRNLYTRLSHLETSPTYRTDNGFRSKNSQRGPRFFGQYHFRFDENHKFLVRITPSLQMGREWNFDNEMNYEFLNPGLEIQFKAQTSMHAAIHWESEKFCGINFKKIYNIHNCFHSSFSKIFQLGANINYGHQIAVRENPPVMGEQISYGGWIDIKPVDQFLIEASYSYLKSNRLKKDLKENPDLPKNLYEDYTFWSRINYQFSRKLSLRVVAQYSDYYKTWAADPLVTYRISAFSVFYIGSSYRYHDYTGLLNSNEEEIPNLDWELDSRQFFMKFQYLFQI
jgi:hypothetical protein